MTDYSSITDNMTNDTDLKLDKLARDVLTLSRNTLLVNLRFMDEALTKLVPKAKEGSISTDGEHLFYDARFVLKRYMAAKELPARDFLHMVLHCVLRHNFEASPMDERCWDIACDMTAENIINELDLKAAESPKRAAQEKELQAMQDKVKYLTAEKIYHQLRTENLTEKELARLSALFVSDDHGLWYDAEDRENESMEESESKPDSPDMPDAHDDPEQQENPENNESRDEDTQSESSEQQSNPQTEPDNSREEAEADWKEIAEHMQMDMETFAKQRGDESAHLMQNLRAVTREKYDYTTFLRKFSVMGEAMKINDDEFDYIFYTYGLSLYEKMPLIEPLEYKEEKRIREFVIAIDTSGSVQGELVQKFIEKTYNILRQSESFFSKINLHIIQCDAEIQEDVKITSRAEFDEYIKNMKLRGFGGTDFRPVFEYVEKLRKEKELTDLKGLIYFTDGDGTFPKKMPDYKTAFVFLDNEYEEAEVPPWAIRMVLAPNEI